MKATKFLWQIFLNKPDCSLLDMTHDHTNTHVHIVLMELKSVTEDELWASRNPILLGSSLWRFGMWILTNLGMSHTKLDNCEMEN